jgi:hypothetical protein
VTGGGSLCLVNGDEEVDTNTVCLLVVCCVCLRHETEARVVHLRFYPPSQVSPLSGLIKPYPLATMRLVSKISPSPVCIVSFLHESRQERGRTKNIFCFDIRKSIIRSFTIS